MFGLLILFIGIALLIGSVGLWTFMKGVIKGLLGCLFLIAVFVVCALLVIAGVSQLGK